MLAYQRPRALAHVEVIGRISHDHVSVDNAGRSYSSSIDNATPTGKRQESGTRTLGRRLLPTYWTPETRSSFENAYMPISDHDVRPVVASIVSWPMWLVAALLVQAVVAARAGAPSERSRLNATWSKKTVGPRHAFVVAARTPSRTRSSSTTGARLPPLSGSIWPSNV